MAITPSQWSHVLTIPESYTPSAPTSGQTLVITESVIAKLSAGDQTVFWSNVQNGGGDVRICTDSGGVNQLPVEVISLDNSAQTCVIWTRKPTYDGLGDLYLFVGKAGETQPPVTEPFGRNAVWVDYEAVLHLNDSLYTDSTGNGHNGSVVGSLSQTNNEHPFGSVWTDFSSSRNNALILQNSGGILDNSFFNVKAWVKTNVVGVGEFAGVISNRLSADSGNWFQIYQRGGADSADWQAILHDGSGESSNVSYDSPTLGGAELLTASSNVTSFDLLVNGSIAVQSAMTGDGQFSTPNDIRVGNYFNGSLGFTGLIGEIRVALGSVDTQKEATEYANQSDPAAFYGTPALATTGVTAGVTASVTESSSDFSESSSASFSANISAQVTEVSASFSDSSSASITNKLVTLSVTETSQDFSESVSASISGSLSVIVTELSQSFTESSSADISANISAAITELAQDFNESAQVNLTSSFTVEVTETTSDFEEACYIQLPVIRLTPRKTISVSNRRSSTIRVRSRNNVIRVK